ncbi:hypothetical protein IIY66_00290 [Candidatus Saccharibacteria bacterium]|nr:hypothetical protein [Candidatus Saccharibacteria bacterium]
MSQYDDIIDLPHFHDSSRPCMTMHDRAAQFAPYKSLVGYDEMIDTKATELLEKEL